MVLWAGAKRCKIFHLRGQCACPSACKCLLILHGGSLATLEVYFIKSFEIWKRLEIFFYLGATECDISRQQDIGEVEKFKLLLCVEISITNAPFN